MYQTKSYYTLTTKVTMHLQKVTMHLVKVIMRLPKVTKGCLKKNAKIALRMQI